MLTKKKFRFSLFDFFLYIFMIIVVLLILLPMIHMLAVSFSSDVYVMQGKVGLWPKGFTAKTYGYVFEDDRIFRSYGNTILYTVLGTTISLSITAMGAYALSAKRMIGHKFFSMMIVFTMFFQGGLIPLFFVIRDTGLYNTIWVSSIPYAVSAYNLIIMKSFFESIPEALEEAATLDGANDFTVLMRIILPLSKPVIAVMILYYGVSQWNSWYPAAMFTRDRTVYPLQMILREILIDNKSVAADSGIAEIEESLSSELVQYCTILVSTVPILIIYPFLQKYFEKGVMIGGVKG